MVPPNARAPQPTAADKRPLPLAVLVTIFVGAIVATYIVAANGDTHPSSDRLSPTQAQCPSCPSSERLASSANFPPSEVSNVQHKRIGIDADANKLTLVLMSYPGSKRFHLLRQIISRALDWPFVFEVLLVWNGAAEAIPADIKELVSDIEHEWNSPTASSATIQLTKNPRVVVLPQELNRVDNRWRIGQRVRTEAVLNMDDDINLRAEGAQCLFDVWKSSPTSIVGLDVRSHFLHRKITGKVMGPYGAYGYAARDTSRRIKKYSMTLPRSLLTTRQHFLAYDRAWRDADSGVKRIVDELLCDDIAFNFVANRHQNVPLSIYAKAAYDSYPESNADGALVKKPGMKANRQKCMNELSAAMNMTLKHRYWHVACSVDG